MNIIKHCKCCGVQFVAHRMATLYCSKACNAKATRVRKKKNLEKEYQELQDDIELSQETTAAPAEFLSPSQAAILLGVSRATIYRYALAGTIKAVQFRGLTIIESLISRRLLTMLLIIRNVHRLARRKKIQNTTLPVKSQRNIILGARLF